MDGFFRGIYRREGGCGRGGERRETGQWHVMAFAFLASFASLSLPLSSLMAAEAKITSPSTASVGSPILIDGTQAKTSGRVEWIISDPASSVFRSPDNRQIVVIAKSKGYLFVGQRAIDADQTEDVKAVVIVVTDSGGEGGGGDIPMPPMPMPMPIPPPIPAPAPAPTPSPSPSPVPQIPTSEAGRQSYEAAMKVSHPLRREHAQKVISQMRRIQEDIKSGKINVKNPLSLRGGLNKIQSENGKLLGPEGLKAWSTWGTWFAGFIYDLYMASKLQTPEAWIEVIGEIIKGLEAVR